MADKETYKLIEKMARAKMRLEDSTQQHKNGCPVECDPEGFAPCNCGASAANAALKRAIKELSFD